MQEHYISVSEHVWVVGRGGGGGGGGVRGCYQPGVYVPLKALFLVSSVVIINPIAENLQKKNN